MGLAGSLLVSRPDTVDPNFDGTVTILLEHNDDGSLGVVLNRPTDMAVAEPFASWADLAVVPACIFRGGPVQPNSIIALGRTIDGAPAHRSAVLPFAMTSVDLDDQPSLLRGEGLASIRIFAGYAGWGPGQLEAELTAGAWWLLDGTPDDVFSSDPSTLWRDVLMRNGGELRWFAHLPGDAALN